MDGFTSGTSFRNFKRAFENKAPIVCSVAKERLGVKCRDQIQCLKMFLTCPATVFVILGTPVGQAMSACAQPKCFVGGETCESCWETAPCCLMLGIHAATGSSWQCFVEEER